MLLTSSLKLKQIIFLLSLSVGIFANYFFASPVMAASPLVISTIPTDKQEGVDIYQPIYITFDLDMDPSTMTSSNLILQDSLAQGVGVRGIHYDSTTKTTSYIPLAPLKQDETYQFTVTTGVKDKNGLSLSQEYKISFKTSLSAATPHPLVLSTIPGYKENPVGIEKDISASFNHDMNSETITKDTFIVEDVNKIPVPAKTVSYDPSSRTATFVPESSLSKNTEYTVTLKKDIKDSTGTMLTQDYIWPFTTGDLNYYDPHGNYTDNTNVCATCHQTHTAKGEALLSSSTETAVCFTCHDGTGSSLEVKNGMIDTTQNKSFHPMMDTGNFEKPQVLKCSDCHDPHAAGNENKNLLRITDVTGTSYETFGSTAEFCIKCHSGTSSTAIGKSTSWDMTNYSTSEHYLNSISCDACHASHESPYPRLMTRGEDTATSGPNGECLSCHANVGSELSQTSHHPTLEISGKHSDTETAADKLDSDPAKRHAECADCHDPHSPSKVDISLERQLCIQCHEPSKYSGSTQNGSTSKFSIDTVNNNLHLVANHSSQDCTACHTNVPHGTSHPGLLALAGEANSSSQIQAFKLVDESGNPIASSNHWVKDSCTTSCHTILP